MKSGGVHTHVCMQSVCDCIAINLQLTEIIAGISNFLDHSCEVTTSFGFSANTVGHLLQIPCEVISTFSEPTSATE